MTMPTIKETLKQVDEISTMLGLKQMVGMTAVFVGITAVARKIMDLMIKSRLNKINHSQWVGTWKDEPSLPTYHFRRYIPTENPHRYRKQNNKKVRR